MSLNLKKLRDEILPFRGKELVLAIVFSIVVASGLFALFWHFRHVDPPKEVSTAKAVEPEITLKEAYAALFRSLKADKICYDEGRNGYFIRFPDDIEDWAGWHYIEGPTFYRIQANNTWFVTDIPASKYAKVYPRVEGMPCALPAEFENQ